MGSVGAPTPSAHRRVGLSAPYAPSGSSKITRRLVGAACDLAAYREVSACWHCEDMRGFVQNVKHNQPPSFTPRVND